MPTDLSFFVAESGALVPTDMALSMWADNMLHGVAVSGALAHAAEEELRAAGRADLVGVRATVDLFRAATTDPCVLSAHVVRESGRLCLIDASLTQGGQQVARSSNLFLKPTASAPGEIWSPTDRPGPPPEDVAPPSGEPHVPYFYSAREKWTQNFAHHQNAARKRSWNSAIPVVAGQPLTGFVAAAAVADGASLVTNWGTGGVEYINSDVTLTLAREPIGLEIGLAAIDRVEQDGIAVGTAAVFDRTGPIGTAVVTSIANVRRTIDFEHMSHPYDDRPTPGA